MNRRADHTLAVSPNHYAQTCVQDMALQEDMVKAENATAATLAALKDLLMTTVDNVEAEASKNISKLQKTVYAEVRCLPPAHHTPPPPHTHDLPLRPSPSLATPSPNARARLRWHAPRVL